jgi:hypothetical protein
MNRAFLRLVALAGIALPAAAQKLPPTGQGWWPLVEGATWTWRLQNAGADPIEHTLTVLGEVEVDKGSCHEMASLMHRHKGYEYWAARDDGIWQYSNAYLGGMRGVNRKDRTQVLKLPIEPGLQWEWTDVMSVQTSGDARQPDPELMRITCQAVLGAVGEAVEVPAGKFTAVRIDTSTRCAYSGTTQASTWWVAGVGAVKTVSHYKHANGGESTQTKELLRYELGKPAAKTDAQALVRKFLGLPDAKLVWMQSDVTRLWCKSLFCRLEADPTRVLRLWKDRVAPFDPKSLADWQQLASDEAIEIGEQLDGHQPATDLAQIAGEVFGFSRGGSWRTRATDFVSELHYDTDTRTITGKVRVTPAGGQEKLHRIELRFARGKLTNVTIE